MSLVIGIVFLVIDILGFVPALVFSDKFLGIFAVNVADNLLHLIVGAAYLGFAPQFSRRRISPTH